MLRIRELEVGGRKYRIGNATLGAQRQFAEALEDKESPVALQRATVGFVLSSLKRAEPGLDVDLEELDSDDMKQLFGAIWEWTQPRDPVPPGEAASP